MTFTPKAALKFLDCEDAHVLQQAIKQCVKKQKGRANSWDYASEIKTDVSFDSSTRVNLFSPTGTTTDYSSKLVSEYKNAKLGIALELEKISNLKKLYDEVKDMRKKQVSYVFTNINKKGKIK